MNIVRIIKCITKRNSHEAYFQNIAYDQRLHVNLQHHHQSSCIQDDSSSLETASNNPGPGRLLGRMYNHFGTKLERLLSKMADRAGYGPVAVYRDLMSIHGNRDFCWEDGELMQSKMSPSVQSYYTSQCKRLLSYT